MQLLDTLLNSEAHHAHTNDGVDHAHTTANLVTSIEEG